MKSLGCLIVGLGLTALLLPANAQSGDNIDWSNLNGEWACEERPGLSPWNQIPRPKDILIQISGGTSWTTTTVHSNCTEMNSDVSCSVETTREFIVRDRSMFATSTNRTIVSADRSGLPLPSEELNALRAQYAEIMGTSVVHETPIEVARVSDLTDDRWNFEYLANPYFCIPREQDIS